MALTPNTSPEDTRVCEDVAVVSSSRPARGDASHAAQSATNSAMPSPATKKTQSIEEGQQRIGSPIAIGNEAGCGGMSERALFEPHVRMQVHLCRLR